MRSKMRIGPMNSANNPFRKAWAAYLGRFNWPVIPTCPPNHIGMSPKHVEVCQSPGKAPLIPGWQRFSTELPREQALREWARRWPWANLSICTGPLFGIVLDVDSKEGEEALKDHGIIPDTPISLTGGGGIHIILRYPGFAVRNSVKSLLPGVDVRGDGGQVVVPPSIHVSGRPYRWDERLHPAKTPMAPCPEWLVELLNGEREFVISPSHPHVRGRIAEGQRNSTIFRLGCSLRAKGLCFVSILAALQAENAVRCDPPLSECEVEAIAQSVDRYPLGSIPSSAVLRKSLHIGILDVEVPL